VYALNATTGHKLWSYTTGDYVYSSPAVTNDVVYIGSGDSSVYALKASTGTLLWSYSTSGEIDSSPAVANGVVYVDSYDGTLYALAGRSGALLWSRYGRYGGNSSIVATGVLYGGSTYNHTVEAYGLKK